MNARSLIVICSLVLCQLDFPVVSRAEEPNTLSPAELDAGWILLFDGQTDYGWKATSKANWKVADGVISVSEGSMGLLRTTSEFGDFELKVDSRNPSFTNSGVFLRTPAEPKDPATDCYELNIAAESVSPFPTGSFVKRKKALETPVREKWRSFHVKAEGGHFTVAVDGRQVLDYLDPKPLGRGYIGLQYNTGAVEFRNVKLKPLGLKSLFNGRDLSGWKTFAGKSSVISVTPEGALNIKNGPGQAESEGLFGDFVFQGEIISNGKELNSGIFFRNIPGSLAQGYESQIQNGYKNGDRTQPKDCGTGGFYRRQNARKVVSNDFEWFHKTLVVSGPHMATWINGYQVSDWTDERKPSENPREGLRLAPGSLTIQGHDPTTNLSFRHLQAAELPPR
jgi:hypothetical protein